MARKADPLPEVIEANIDHDQFNADVAHMNTLSMMHTEAQVNANSLAKQLGYEGALTVGALEDEIRFYQRRTAEACFELGKRLLMLRELTPHGEFKSRIDLLGIEYTAAKRFMGVANKFSKGATSHLLKAADSQSKLLELLVLDDEEISELESGESVRGITLDKIETMSVRELKKALRESNANLEIKEQQIASKDMKLNELDAKLFSKLTLDPQEVWTNKMRLVFEMVSSHKQTAVEAITALDVIREKAFQLTIDTPGEEAALARAQHEVGMELMQALERIEQQIAGVRRSFDCTLGALIGE